MSLAEVQFKIPLAVLKVFVPFLIFHVPRERKDLEVSQDPRENQGYRWVIYHGPIYSSYILI